MSHKYSTKTTLVVVEVIQELILLLQRPVARAAGVPADLLRATENATSLVKDVAKMLASTMKESMSRPAEPTAALPRWEVLVGE